MAQILEALKGHNQLIDVLKDIVDRYRGNMVFEDNRSEGFISELTVYSECFTKDHLNVLFQYAEYPQITDAKGKMKICLSLDL